MILVRQPHCWRFLYPLAPMRSRAEQRTNSEKRSCASSVRSTGSKFSTPSSTAFTTASRRKWRRDRVFLMGDAAHLITPMWALGLNTGILDAISLPWRLAWVARGWAGDALLDGYAREQRPVAAKGSGEMAEAARKYMAGQATYVKAMSGTRLGQRARPGPCWGVRLDVDETGDWSMVKTDRGPFRVGDRIPDADLHGPNGHPVRLHELIDDSFVALYFTDVAAGPRFPGRYPGLKHLSCRTAMRRSMAACASARYLDVGDRFRECGLPDRHVRAGSSRRPYRGDRHRCAAEVPRSYTERWSAVPMACSTDRRSIMAAETATTRTLGPIGDKIVFENEFVRVWSLALEPGQRQPWHQHLLPYLIVPLTEGKNEMTFDDGRVRETQEKPGEVIWREPGIPHELSTAAIGSIATSSSRSKRARRETVAA